SSPRPPHSRSSWPGSTRPPNRVFRRQDRWSGCGVLWVAGSSPAMTADGAEIASKPQEKVPEWRMRGRWDGEGLMVSLSNHDAAALGATPSWFDKLTMRAAAGLAERVYWRFTAIGRRVRPLESRLAAARRPG